MREYVKKHFSFRGRIGRRHYWVSTLLYVLAFIVGIGVMITLAALNYNPPDDTITARTIVGFVLLGIAMIGFIFAISIGLASSGVRRLHDRGKSGYWLMLYYLLPWMMVKNAYWDIVGAIICGLAAVIVMWAMIDLGILRGENRSNAFGSNPLSKSPDLPVAT